MGNTSIIPNVYLTPNQTINKSGTYSIYDSGGDPGLEIEQVNTNMRKRTLSDVNSIGQFIVDIDVVVVKGIRYYNPDLQDYDIILFGNFNKTTEGTFIDIPQGKILVIFFYKGINELTVASYANYDTGSKSKSLDANTYYTLINRGSDGEWYNTNIELINMKDQKMLDWSYRMGDFTNTVYTHIFSINPLLLECRGLYED